MDKIENFKHQSALREWIDISKWKNPCFVTLTMKKGKTYYSNSGSTRKKITKYEASSNFRHFLNILNKRIFGNGFTRYGKCMTVFAVLEGTKTKHLHYHAIIDVPLGKGINNFEQMVLETWLATEWGDKQIDVKFNANQGAVNYMTKTRDKYSVADSIDWSNVALGN